jgi:hypothetical protein
MEYAPGDLRSIDDAIHALVRTVGANPLADGNPRR